MICTEEGLQPTELVFMGLLGDAEADKITPMKLWNQLECNAVKLK